MIRVALIAFALGCGGRAAAPPPSPSTPSPSPSDVVAVDATVSLVRRSGDASLEDVRDLLDERLAWLGITATLAIDGSAVRVTAPGLPRGRVDALRDALTRPPRFELRLVDPPDRGGFVALTDGLRLEKDEWEGADGQPVRTMILVAEGAARAPALHEAGARVFHDRDVGVQRIQERDDVRWIAYPLARAPETRLGGVMVNRAFVELHPTTLVPEVRIRFTGDGTARLAELTTRHTGRKVAIVLDDRVLAAPIVTSPITVGEIALLLGDMPEETRHPHAQALVGAIRRSTHDLQFELGAFDIRPAE